MNEELKPCPFCCHHPYARCEWERKGMIGWLVFCHNWFCKTDAFNFELPFDSKEQAIEAWNIRYK